MPILGAVMARGARSVLGAPPNACRVTNAARQWMRVLQQPMLATRAAGFFGMLSSNDLSVPRRPVSERQLSVQNALRSLLLGRVPNGRCPLSGGRRTLSA